MLLVRVRESGNGSTVWGAAPFTAACTELVERRMTSDQVRRGEIGKSEGP